MFTSHNLQLIAYYSIDKYNKQSYYVKENKWTGESAGPWARRSWKRTLRVWHSNSHEGRARLSCKSVQNFGYQIFVWIKICTPLLIRTFVPRPKLRPSLVMNGETVRCHKTQHNQGIWANIDAEYCSCTSIELFDAIGCGAFKKETTHQADTEAWFNPLHGTIVQRLC